MSSPEDDQHSDITSTSGDVDGLNDYSIAEYFEKYRVQALGASDEEDDPSETNSDSNDSMSHRNEKCKFSLRPNAFSPKMIRHLCMAPYVKLKISIKIFILRCSVARKSNLMINEHRERHATSSYSLSERREQRTKRATLISIEMASAAPVFVQSSSYSGFRVTRPIQFSP